MTVKRLNWSSTSKPTSACASMKMVACATVTWPEGIGRERVRSTRPSRSRSTRSFQVQPAPRMAKAPMKNSTMCQRLGKRSCACRRGRPTTSTASAAARSRSAGRDGQAADRGGCMAGARPSTQFPVASATRPVALAHFPSGVPVRVSKVPRPVLMLLEFGTGLVSASLRLGPGGLRRRGGNLANSGAHLGRLGDALL